MNEQQFETLLQEIQMTKHAIVEKLEEIRCGLIDIETSQEKQAQQDDSADKFPDMKRCTSCGTHHHKMAMCPKCYG